MHPCPQSLDYAMYSNPFLELYRPCITSNLTILEQDLNKHTKASIIDSAFLEADKLSKENTSLMNKKKQENFIRYIKIDYPKSK